MSDSLQALFRPSRLAVIGASAKPEKMGFQIFKNILDAGFGGPVIPVNPKGETILGVPSVKSIEEIPSGTDLAVVIIPAASVPGAILQLAHLPLPELQNGAGHGGGWNDDDGQIGAGRDFLDRFDGREPEDRFSLGVDGNDLAAETCIQDVLEDRESQLPRLCGGPDDGEAVGAKKRLEGVTHVAPRDRARRSLSRQVARAAKLLVRAQRRKSRGCEVLPRPPVETRDPTGLREADRGENALRSRARPDHHRRR